MAGNPPGPDPADRSPSASRGEPPAHASGEERCGPVAISRHRKDDGRALLLYSRVSEPHA